MGRAKDAMIEEEQQGFVTPLNKYVCLKHFYDKGLKEFVISKAKNRQMSCAYCGSVYNTIHLSELLSFIYTRLKERFGHPDDEGVGYDSSIWNEDDEESYFNHDYGYILPSNRYIYTTEEVFEHIGFDDDIDNENLYQDVISASTNNLWCYSDPYGMKLDEELSFLWEQYCSYVKKYKNTYSFNHHPTFKNVITSENGLSDILTEINILIKNCSLIRTLPKDTLIYRARNHSKSEKIELFSQIGAPALKYIKYPNRMSPIDVSMFYGAGTKQTALLEAQSDNSFSDMVTTVGYFKLKKDINIIDFTNIKKDVSFWGDDNLEIIGFLRSFVNEISKPIDTKNDVQTEYLPTQILTGYFRRNFSNIDGLIYKSVKDKEGKCYVLFYDNIESELKLSLAQIDPLCHL